MASRNSVKAFHPRGRRRRPVDLSRCEVVAAADAEESASVAANLAGSGRADALVKGSLHAESHAGIFGLSLAALLAACLTLNAASPSTRICQQADRDFGTTGAGSVSAATRVVAAPGDGSHAELFGMIRSKACATSQDREEPGYR